MQVSTTIDIYDGVLTLFVTDNVVKTRRENSDKFGLCLIDSCNAMASSSDCGFYYAMFFHRDNLNPGILAHEIFHVTHRILHNRGLTFHIDHQESFAYLNEWITNWTYKVLAEEKLIRAPKNLYAPKKN